MRSSNGAASELNVLTELDIIPGIDELVIGLTAMTYTPAQPAPVRDIKPRVIGPLERRVQRLERRVAELEERAASGR